MTMWSSRLSVREDAREKNRAPVLEHISSPNRASGQEAAPALALEDVHVTYPDGYEAVRGISMHVDDGEIIGLLGASGSGKSSILRGVAGLEKTRGIVRVDGKDISHTPIHKRSVGMVFQQPQLFPHRSVGGNIAYGIERQMSRAHVKAEVSCLLDLVGLSGFEERPVQTLSGGQAQRCALARALATRPRILLLDEPLSALDRRLREELSQELRRILTQAGTAAVYVTHDHEEARVVADRVAFIAEGQISRWVSVDGDFVQSDWKSSPSEQGVYVDGRIISVLPRNTLRVEMEAEVDFPIPTPLARHAGAGMPVKIRVELVGAKEAASAQ